MEFKAATPADLPPVARQILESFSDQTVFVFYGKMGAGKTTLIKALCEALGVMDATSSPTYSVVNQYLTESGVTVYHFDFYRLEDEEEVYDIGYEEYIYSGDTCFIEWPERIENLLPPNYVSITISEHNTERIIKVEPC